MIGRIFLPILLFLSLSIVAQDSSKISKGVEFFDKGVVESDERKFLAAISDYTEAIKINPKYSDAYFYRGCAHFELENYEKSIKDFDKAIAVNPYYVDAYYYIGLANDRLAEKEKNKNKIKKIELPSDSLLDKSLSPKTARFLQNLSKVDYTKISKAEAKEYLSQIDSELHKLMEESDSISKLDKPNIVQLEANKRAIETLQHQKRLQSTIIEREGFKVEVNFLQKVLIWVSIFMVIMIIIISLTWKTLKQKKRIEKLTKDVEQQMNDIETKNGFLEYSARLIRHDMHSGINTYIPRGLSSLEKKIPEDVIQNLKIETSLKMIKDGLSHTQRVYKEVFNFSNLVKKDIVLEKKLCNIKLILENHIENTAYKSKVNISEDLPDLQVNENLFLLAIEHFIKNGLKYNDSEEKVVKIYMDNEYICVEDNGRGMSQEEFIELAKPFARKENQTETGDGIGLTISLAILKEHAFTVSSEKTKPNGTIIKIKIFEND